MAGGRSGKHGRSRTRRAYSSRSNTKTVLMVEMEDSLWARYKVMRDQQGMQDEPFIAHLLDLEEQNLNLKKNGGEESDERKGDDANDDVSSDGDCASSANGNYSDENNSNLPHSSPSLSHSSRSRSRSSSQSRGSFSGSEGGNDEDSEREDKNNNDERQSKEGSDTGKDGDKEDSQKEGSKSMFPVFADMLGLFKNSPGAATSHNLPDAGKFLVPRNFRKSQRKRPKERIQEIMEAEKASVNSEDDVQEEAVAPKQQRPRITMRLPNPNKKKVQKGKETEKEVEVENESPDAKSETESIKRRGRRKKTSKQEESSVDDTVTEKAKKPSQKKSEKHQADKKLKEMIKPGSLQCTFCDKVFKTTTGYKLHQQKHLEPEKFKCDKCDYATPYKANFEKHFQTRHSDSRDVGVQCKICKKWVKEKKYLPCHMKRMHGTNRSYSCGHCGREFKMPHDLQRHITNMHSENITMHTCTYEDCSYMSKYKSAIKEHIRRRHLKQTKHVCEICQKGFFTKRYLENHMMTHTGEKPFACDWEGCTHRFRLRYHLRVHYRIHTGDKPNKCPLCDYAGRQRNSLHWHMRSKHSGVNVKY